MAALHGIVAIITTAPNKIPKYWGYDLRIKHPDAKRHGDLTPDDFHLIFEGQSMDKHQKFKQEKVLPNIDKTIFTMYKQEIDLGTKFEEECAKVENHSIQLQGQIIKEITEVDGEQKVTLVSPEAKAAEATINKMFNCWVNAKMKRMELIEKLSEDYRVGTLDIAVFNEQERLVLRTSKTTYADPQGEITLKQLKDTLFFVCEVYKTTQEFQNKINLVHKENGYICEVEKNKFSFDKTTKFTEMEIAIAKDILKLNKMLGG